MGNSVKGKFETSVNSVDVNAVRSVFDKRLGEIITEVVGDSHVQALFEAAGKHPNEYKDQPTGEIALKLGVITPGTKTALLVAQAAERTYRLAGKAEKIAAEHLDMIMAEEIADWKDVVRHDDPVFKFVGSDKDPAILRKAQGTWMAAQMLLNNEIESVNNAINHSFPVSSMDVPAAQGFKNAAVELYAEAASLLAQEGHAEAAAKVQAVRDTLATENTGNKPAIHPITTLDRMAWNEAKARLDLDAWTSSGPVSLEGEYKKLQGIIERPGGEDKKSPTTAPVAVPR